jgi:hypothetical protein
VNKCGVRSIRENLGGKRVLELRTDTKLAED